jgi:hypothetical protein
MPGTNSGTSQGSSSGRGDVAGSGRTGSQQGSSSGQTGSTNGTGNDPFGGLGTPGSGGMTAAERRAVLDARLEAGYSVFDGMILGERERAQADADAAGSSVMGAGGAGAGGDGSEARNGSPVIIASAEGATTGGGHLPAGTMSREGDYSGQNQPTFPVPDDIPNGNDDDVVARQLREAAMREADPELREKLWDEYRKYTGLSR